jgi:hypothetical protein
MSGPRSDEGQGKPAEDRMHGAPGRADDLVGEVSRLAADPHSDDAEILRKLEVLAENFSVDEVFAVMVQYDTPDLLG